MTKMPGFPSHRARHRYNRGMGCEEIIRTLGDAMPELRREFPLRSLSLFGSAARGEERPGSDIDILVEFEPDARVTLFTFSRLLRRLTEVLGRGVDLVEDHPGLSDSFRASVTRDSRRVA